MECDLFAEIMIVVILSSGLLSQHFSGVVRFFPFFQVLCVDECLDDISDSKFL